MSNLFLYHHCSLLHFSLFQPLKVIWNFVRVLWGLERERQRSLSTIYSRPPPLHPSSKSPCSKWGHQQRLRSRVSAAVFPLLLDGTSRTTPHHTTATAALVPEPVSTSLTGLNWRHTSSVTPQPGRAVTTDRNLSHRCRKMYLPRISWPSCPYSPVYTWFWHGAFVLIFSTLWLCSPF